MICKHAHEMKMQQPPTSMLYLTLTSMPRLVTYTSMLGGDGTITYLGVKWMLSVEQNDKAIITYLGVKQNDGATITYSGVNQRW